MRRSPLHEWHASRCTEWVTVNGMRMPVRFDGEPASPPVALADVSAGLRAGLKGPGAAAWLAGRGVAVPARPNHWIASAPQRRISSGRPPIPAQQQAVAGANTSRTESRAPGTRL